MKVYYKKPDPKGPSSVTVGIVYILSFVVGANLVLVPLSLWTWRSLDFWVELYRGCSVDTPWVMAYLLTLLAPFAVVLNIATEVARLFLVG